MDWNVRENGTYVRMFYFWKTSFSKSSLSENRVLSAVYCWEFSKRILMFDKDYQKLANNYKKLFIHVYSSTMCIHFKQNIYNYI